jgi:hypothetical protein
MSCIYKLLTRNTLTTKEWNIRIQNLDINVINDFVDNLKTSFVYNDRSMKPTILLNTNYYPLMLLLHEYILYKSNEHNDDSFYIPAKVFNIMLYMISYHGINFNNDHNKDIKNLCQTFDNYVLKKFIEEWNYMYEKDNFYTFHDHETILLVISLGYKIEYINSKILRCVSDESQINKIFEMALDDFWSIVFVNGDIDLTDNINSVQYDNLNKMINHYCSSVDLFNIYICNFKELIAAYDRNTDKSITISDKTIKSIFGFVLMNILSASRVLSTEQINQMESIKKYLPHENLKEVFGNSENRYYIFVVTWCINQMFHKLNTWITDNFNYSYHSDYEVISNAIDNIYIGIDKNSNRFNEYLIDLMKQQKRIAIEYYKIRNLASNIVTTVNIERFALRYSQFCDRMLIHLAIEEDMLSSVYFNYFTDIVTGTLTKAAIKSLH